MQTDWNRVREVEYRTVRSGFWHDPYIEGLDAKAKLLYLYLFTGPYTNNLGIVEVTRRKIVYETGLSQSEVEKFLIEFEANGKIVCDQGRNLILMTRFIKHQTTTGDLLVKSLKKLVSGIASPVIAKSLCIRYPHLYDIDLDGMDTVSIPYADGVHTLDIPSDEFGSWKCEVGKVKGEDPAGSKPPACPHTKIREMYHEMLPTLPRTVTWDDARQKNLKARWNETWERQRRLNKPHEEQDLLEWWKAFFARVRASPFLMGQEAGRNGTPFFASLDWLVRPKNYADVLDQKYRDRSLQQRLPT